MIDTLIVCPNCLTGVPITKNTILMFDQFELIQNKYKPTICAMCGVSLLIDKDYKASILHGSIEISPKTFNALIAMRNYATQMNLSKYKQPWNN